MTNRREKIGKRDACSMTSIFKLRAKKKGTRIIKQIH